MSRPLQRNVRRHSMDRIGLREGSQHAGPRTLSHISWSLGCVSIVVVYGLSCLADPSTSAGFSRLPWSDLPFHSEPICPPSQSGARGRIWLLSRPLVHFASVPASATAAESMGSSGSGEPNHDPAANVKAPANAPSAAGQDGRIGGSLTRGRREVTAPEAALNE